MLKDITYSPEWDKIHKEWSDRYKWQPRPDRDFAQFFLVENPKEGSRFLDLGCGYGSNALPLVSRGYVVEAIDGCRDAINSLNGHKSVFPGLLPTLGNIGTLERKAESIDYVLDICSLEIFCNAACREFIKRCSVWLKPDGKIFSKMACDPFDRRLMRFPVETRSLGDVKYIFNGFVIDVLRSFECNEYGLLQTHWLVTTQRRI